MSAVRGTVVAGNVLLARAPLGWSLVGAQTGDGATLFIETRITGYQNFTELLSLADGGTNPVYVEGAADNSLVLGFYGSSSGGTLWTDGYTGRFWLALRFTNVGGGQLAVESFTQRQGGLFTVGPAGTNDNFTLATISLFSEPLFAGDMNGVLDYSLLFLYRIPMSNAQLQRQMGNRMPIMGSPALDTWLDMLNASSPGKNLARPGADFVLTGAPVLITDTDPMVPRYRSVG